VDRRRRRHIRRNRREGSRWPNPTRPFPSESLSASPLSPSFPLFFLSFPLFFLLLSENRTHRYREIANLGYCTNTVGVQLTGGETKQQAYNSLEIFSE
jgi:hypothetical protein